jgi:hypothetical protein
MYIISDRTVADATAAAKNSRSSITINSTGTDTIVYFCIGS